MSKGPLTAIIIGGGKFGIVFIFVFRDTQDLSLKRVGKCTKSSSFPSITFLIEQEVLT